jgi:hypothetical protein
VQEARSIFTRLRATSWLKRCDQLDEPEAPGSPIVEAAQASQ